MAITQIYGFQNFGDYLDRDIINFTPFGKLPFHNNRWHFGSPGFKFEKWGKENRIWLRSFIGSAGTSNTASFRRQQTNASFSASLNFPFAAVYPEHLDKGIEKFNIGIRFGFPFTGTRRPQETLRIVSSGGDISTTGFVILDLDECPNVNNVEFYVEAEIDLNLSVCRRWLDSVRLPDIALPSWVNTDTMSDLHWHIGRKWVSSSSDHTSAQNHFCINDLYFIADTSHLNDGLPSGRLGPIEVEPLIPKAVTLPETWNNETDKEPTALLKETVNTTNMRGRPSLVSDEAGDRAVVEFEEPDFREGEILYCEIETYGYRNFGDNVGLNTRIKQGTGEATPKHHEVEPERLRVGDRTIFPGKLHKPLDGEEWTEEKLGQIKLELWSTKPE